MAAGLRCWKGHALSHLDWSSPVGSVSKRNCSACNHLIELGSHGLACQQCVDFRLCSTCAGHSQAGQACVGDGPCSFKVCVPAWAGAGKPIGLVAPDGQPLEVRMPQGAHPGDVLEIRHWPADGESAAPAEQPWLGYRWFAVLAVGLAQLLLAPSGLVPWLPADTVLISSGSAWACWTVVGSFAVFAALPLDQHGRSWLRFVSAAVQGFIFGHLVVFNLATLPLRAALAIGLGVANAYDRFAALGDEQQQEQDAETPRTPSPTLELRRRLAQGFQLKPWGFACGTILVQWRGLSAHVLEQHAFSFASLPVSAALLWYVVQSRSWRHLWLVCAIFLLCVLDVLTLLPSLIGLTASMAARLLSHQVVVFVAILVDSLVFEFGPCPCPFGATESKDTESEDRPDEEEAPQPFRARSRSIERVAALAQAVGHAPQHLAAAAPSLQGIRHAVGHAPQHLAAATPSFQSIRHAVGHAPERVAAAAPSFQSIRNAVGHAPECVAAAAPSFQSIRQAVGNAPERVAAAAPSFQSIRQAVGDAPERVADAAPSLQSIRQAVGQAPERFAALASTLQSSGHVVGQAAQHMAAAAPAAPAPPRAGHTVAVGPALQRAAPAVPGPWRQPLAQPLLRQSS